MALQKYKLQERQVNLPVNKLEFHAFTNSRKAETLPYERRLIINHRTHSFFFHIFFSRRNTLSCSEKLPTKDLVDQGPHTVAHA